MVALDPAVPPLLLLLLVAAELLEPIAEVIELLRIELIWEVFRL